MLPKDKFVTTSLKSTTNSSGCDTPIQFIKGVGPKLGALFNSRQISTVRDLLFFFPRSYEDRSQVYQIHQLEEGMTATVAVRILSRRRIPIRSRGLSLLEARCADETGTLSLKWFHTPAYLEKKLLPGVSVVVTGKVRFYLGKPEILHPEMTWGASADPQPHTGRVVPIYTEIEGVSTRTLRNVLWEAVEKYGSFLPEDLPSYLLKRRNLPSLSQAVRDLHFPSVQNQPDLQSLLDFRTPAHERLIYGELFKFEYLMVRKKLNLERACGPFRALQGGKEHRRKKMQDLVEALPFRLTAGQTQALWEICEDFEREYPMNRLVQGDVGSGKTAVAFLSAAYLMAGGGQVALMVPTEILAEQHFRNATRLFTQEASTHIALLTGKSTPAERQILREKFASGDPVLAIGTHALLEDWVEFSNLVYIMIDEQHRFGVEQRRILRRKGIKGQKGVTVLPHSLILTATPIPRTLALTAFGDLSVSTIRELPPGRSPIRTRIVRDQSQRARAYTEIRNELRAGRQAYFIYPLIHESEAEGFTQLRSAVNEAQLLAEKVFPEFTVGLMHGQLSPEQKEEVMDRFQRGLIQVMVSTTVVEVGVDVPNATVIVIEHAERFGLSQLHQLRGRVGRGRLQSYCYLFSTRKMNPRLEILEESEDGFKIAEADLEIRGPGEFLGTRQAGALPFKMANLARDQEWLQKARDDAMRVLADDPELQDLEHESLRKFHQREGDVQQERLTT